MMSSTTTLYTHEDPYDYKHSDSQVQGSAIWPEDHPRHTVISPKSTRRELSHPDSFAIELLGEASPLESARLSEERVQSLLSLLGDDNIISELDKHFELHTSDQFVINRVDSHPEYNYLQPPAPPYLLPHPAAYATVPLVDNIPPHTGSPSHTTGFALDRADADYSFPPQHAANRQHNYVNFKAEPSTALDRNSMAANAMSTSVRNNSNGKVSRRSRPSRPNSELSKAWTNLSSSSSSPSSGDTNASGPNGSKSFSNSLSRFTLPDENGKRKIKHDILTIAEQLPTLPGLYFDKKQKGFRVRYQNVYVGWVALSRFASIEEAYISARDIWENAKAHAEKFQTPHAAIMASFSLQKEAQTGGKNRGGRPRTVTQLPPSPAEWLTSAYMAQHQVSAWPPSGANDPAGSFLSHFGGGGDLFDVGSRQDRNEMYRNDANVSFGGGWASPSYSGPPVPTPLADSLSVDTHNTEHALGVENQRIWTPNGAPTCYNSTHANTTTTRASSAEVAPPFGDDLGGTYEYLRSQGAELCPLLDNVHGDEAASLSAFLDLANNLDTLNPTKNHFTRPYAGAISLSHPVQCNEPEETNSEDWPSSLVADIPTPSNPPPNGSDAFAEVSGSSSFSSRKERARKASEAALAPTPVGTKRLCESRGPDGCSSKQPRSAQGCDTAKSSIRSSFFANTEGFFSDESSSFLPPPSTTLVHGAPPPPTLKSTGTDAAALDPQAAKGGSSDEPVNHLASLLDWSRRQRCSASGQLPTTKAQQ